MFPKGVQTKSIQYCLHLIRLHTTTTICKHIYFLNTFLARRTTDFIYSLHSLFEKIKLSFKEVLNCKWSGNNGVFSKVFNYDLTPNRGTGENKTNCGKFPVTSLVLHPKGILYNVVASCCLLHKNYELAKGCKKALKSFEATGLLKLWHRGVVMIKAFNSLRFVLSR